MFYKEALKAKKDYKTQKASGNNSSNKNKNKKK